MNKVYRDIKDVIQIIGVILIGGWVITCGGWVAVGMAFQDYPAIGWGFLVINTIIWTLILIHRYVHRLEIFESTKKEFRNKN